MIIIDCHQLCYAAYYKTAHLEWEGEKTGIIFGFLQQLLTIAKELYPKYSPFIFAWDSSSKIRKIHYKAYKANRQSKLTNKDYHQFNLLRKEILPEMGFKNIFRWTGLEADDVIAIICKKKKGKKIIVSSDSDLYQLLDNKTHMFNLRTKKYYSKKYFINDYSIIPKQWPLVKAIAGCNTDNIDGIAKGIGEKTAIKYILNKKLNDKIKQKINKNKSIIDLNLLLTRLPFNNISYNPSIKKDTLVLDDFERICIQYGFSYFRKNLDEWKEAFNMSSVLTKEELLS